LNINTNEVIIENEVDIEYRHKAIEAIKKNDEMLKVKNGKINYGKAMEGMAFC